MKKIVIALILVLVIAGLLLLTCLSDGGIFGLFTGEKKTGTELSLEAFAGLKEKVSDAGYIVSDTVVDSSFVGVLDSFSFKINFDTNTIASIPVILTEKEEDAQKNCSFFGEDSIKLPIQKGCIFSYPGKDYPEKVLEVVRAIVYDEEIPKNEYAK